MLTTNPSSPAQAGASNSSLRPAWANVARSKTTRGEGLVPRRGCTTNLQRVRRGVPCGPSAPTYSNSGAYLGDFGPALPPNGP